MGSGFLAYLPLIIMFILFLIRIPVALAILIPTAIYFTFVNTLMPKEMMIQSMMATTESFPYLAIPLFTCAGVVFNYSGITRRLIRLAELLIGHLRGGMAQVNVLTSVLMGGLSGSANADAAMSTKMIVPEMTRVGYGKGFSTALTAAASCITPIIPPGIILILYALAANVSIARMFFAGVLPGLLMAVALMITVAIMARVRDYRASRDTRASLGEIGRHMLGSFWALLLPFGILMGLRFGAFTPTEAGAISVLYALAVGAFIYRELRWKHIPQILMESALATAGVMFIICAAIAFSTYLTWEGIPRTIATLLTDNITNPIVLLLLINVLLLIIGTFFEGGAAMIIMAPLFVPVILAMGIDPIHFGIMMSINLVLGGFTPPVGTMMFITITIANVKIIDYVKECWPFLIALLLVLFLVTFVPSISLFLPNLLL